MIRILYAALFLIVTNTAFAQSSQIDCTKTQHHPKSRAECFFLEQIKNPTNPQIIKILKEFENEGFDGPSFEYLSVYVKGTCANVHHDINCDWVYQVSTDFQKYPKSGNIFSYGESIHLLIEASHDLNKTPKILKVFSSRQLNML